MMSLLALGIPLEREMGTVGFTICSFLLALVAQAIAISIAIPVYFFKVYLPYFLLSIYYECAVGYSGVSLAKMGRRRNSRENLKI